MCLTVQIRYGLVVLLLAMGLSGCDHSMGLDQHGQKVTTKQIENQWLILNYWAEWCAACRREIPELNWLAANAKDEAVHILGVNFDGLTGEQLAKASSEMGIEFRVLAQDPAAQFSLPKVAVLPITFIVDETGVLRETLAGEQTAEGLQQHLKRLRGQQP